MFKKIFFLFMLFCFQCQAFAGEISSSINDILNSFDFDRDSVVSISVKDANTGVFVYNKGGYKYLNPASSLKLFTMAASMNTLGENFTFDMAFYKDKNNNLYLKLSGDPLFTTADMNMLAKNLKAAYKGKINKIFIDDSVMDKVPYPDGWTIDDYWPNSPKISPYMVDNNTVKIDILLTPEGTVRIVQKNPYRFSFISKLIKGENNDIKFVQDDIHNTVNVEGTISNNVIDMEIPVLNPRYFFCNKLTDALNKNGVSYHNKFMFAKVPEDAIYVAKFSRPLSDVIKHTLDNSDNTACEMVFKVAGGSFAKKNSPVEDSFTSFGTTQNGINMFYSYFDKLNLDTKNIKIRDGSGVSRYNAMNTSWMTDALYKMNFDCKKYLPTAGSGTLSKRMREMENSVYFKTGTLFGTSSLTGMIESGNKKYYYASIIMSYNRNKSIIKGVEDEIIYEIYRADL